jgi:hypothetical protein
MQPLGVETGDPSGGLSHDGCRRIHGRGRSISMVLTARFSVSIRALSRASAMEPAMPAAVSASVKPSEVHCSDSSTARIQGVVARGLLQLGRLLACEAAASLEG